jgi:hypothetical protein
MSPDIAKEFGVKNRYDPYQAIMGQARGLKKYHDEFGTWDAAISAWNEGEAGYRKDLGLGVEHYKDGTNYNQRVAAMQQNINVQVDVEVRAHDQAGNTLPSRQTVIKGGTTAPRSGP